VDDLILGSGIVPLLKLYPQKTVNVSELPSSPAQGKQTFARFKPMWSMPRRIGRFRNKFKAEFLTSTRPGTVESTRGHRALLGCVRRKI
jgi:hypothetical protein